MPVGIAAGSFVALLFRISGMFLWAVIGVLTARTLDVDDRGVYASAVVVASVVGGVASLGAASGYFVANRRLSPAEVASNGIFVSVPVAIALAAGVALFAPSVSQASTDVIVLAALATAPIIVRGTMGGVLMGSGSIVRFNIASHISIMLAFGFLFTWLVILDRREVESALQAWCIAQYVSLLPYLFWGKGWWRWFVQHRPNPRLMAGLVRFSLITGFGGVIGILNYRIDQLLVIRLDSEEGAGIYSSAIAVAEGLWLFSSAIALASFARVGQGERREAARLTATGVRHTLMVVLVGGGGAVILGPWLVETVFGAPYRGAAEPLRILCIGTALFAPQGLLNNYFVNQLGRPSFPLIIGSISLVISVAFGLVLIPDFGTVGAAWATTIGYGVSSVISVALFCRGSGVPFSELWRVRSSDILSYLELARDVLSGRAFAARRAVSSET